MWNRWFWICGFCFNLIHTQLFVSKRLGLYRIDFIFVTNRLRSVSKQLVSKWLCIEMTGIQNSSSSVDLLWQKKLYTRRIMLKLSNSFPYLCYLSFDAQSPSRFNSFRLKWNHSKQWKAIKSEYQKTELKFITKKSAQKHSH